MRTRFFQLWAVLALVLCFSAGSAQPTSVATAQNKGIDPALLAKAEAGGAEAQYKLGNLYYSGDGGRRDYSQAEFWYRRGAEQGNPDSQFMLGGLYHFGQGVPQDSAQAFAWIIKAAKQGHTDAEFFIATCYTEGWGVAKDDVQGIVWLRKAAEQGDATSQYMLGRAYAAGIGVPTDYAEACFWLDVAASGKIAGSKRKEVVKMRGEAASHLTPADLSRAEVRVRQWLQDQPAQPPRL